MEYTRGLEIHDPIKQELNSWLLFVRHTGENNGMYPSLDQEPFWKLGHPVSEALGAFSRQIKVWSRVPFLVVATETHPRGCHVYDFSEGVSFFSPKFFICNLHTLNLVLVAAAD